MRIVILGAGEVGSHLAKMLRREANDIVVIDNDETRIKALTDYADVTAVQGSPISIDTLKRAGAGKCDLFIGVYPYEERGLNVLSAIIAKKLGAGKVIARVQDDGYLTSENKLMFKELGIELMIYPERIAADEIVDQLRHAASSETMDFVHGKLQMAVFRLEENSPVLDMQLLQFIKILKPQEAKEFRVIAISRNGNTIIPSADTKFLYNDLVFTIATRQGIDSILHRFGKTSVEVSKVMILGGGNTAEMVAASLSRQDIEVKIIEKNKERCLELAENLPATVQIACGDGRNSDVLNDEDIREYDAFVALSGSDETNVLACVVAKKFGVPRTIAEVENIEYIHLSEDMGVDTIINKKLITAGRIFKFTLGGKARFVKYMSGTSAEVVEYTVAPGSAITKAPLRDIPFPTDAIVGGVVRGSEAMIAIGDTVIEPYDRVAVFALPQAIKEIDRFFK